jgi:hypothetical protein
MRRLTWSAERRRASETVDPKTFNSRRSDQEARAVLASTLPVPLHGLQTSLLPRSRVQPMPRQRGQASLVAGAGPGARMDVRVPKLIANSPYVVCFAPCDRQARHYRHGFNGPAENYVKLNVTGRADWSDSD